jgi:hypothetical protein
MKKLFKFIGNGLKKFAKNLTERTFLILGFVLTWGVPIYLLADQVALTKEVNTKWKFTFVGLAVIVFVAIKFYGKIKNKIINIEPKTRSMLAVQIVFIALQKVITLGSIALLLHFTINFITKISEWYLASLIPIGLGVVCYIIDRIIMFKKERRLEKEEHEKLKEQIKGEVLNGE